MEGVPALEPYSQKARCLENFWGALSATATGLGIWVPPRVAVASQWCSQGWLINVAGFRHRVIASDAADPFGTCYFRIQGRRDQQEPQYSLVSAQRLRTLLAFRLRAVSTPRLFFWHGQRDRKTLAENIQTAHTDGHSKRSSPGSFCRSGLFPGGSLRSKRRRKHHCWSRIQGDGRPQSLRQRWPPRHRG